MSTTNHTGTLTLERMRSSRHGNPRYRCLIDDVPIGTTRPDASIAYGAVPNHDGRAVTVEVYHTPTGRRYVQSVRAHPEGA